MKLRLPTLIADTIDPDFWAALARSVRMPVFPHRHTSIFSIGGSFFAVYWTERAPGRYDDWNIETLSKEVVQRYFTNGSMRRKFLEQLP